MTIDYGAGTAYRAEMREAIKAFFQPDHRVDLTNLLNTLVGIAYQHHRAIYLAGNQASADRMVGSSAELASADYVEGLKNRAAHVAARGDSGAEARAEPSEQPQWTIDGTTYSRPTSRRGEPLVSSDVRDGSARVTGYLGFGGDTPIGSLHDRVAELERWRSTCQVVPPQIVSCKACDGQGQVYGPAPGPAMVSCSGCKGAGVHRV